MADPTVAAIPQIMGQFSERPVFGQHLDGHGSRIAWSPEPGTTVKVQTMGTLNETLNVASTVTKISADRWAESGVVIEETLHEKGCDFVHPC